MSDDIKTPRTITTKVQRPDMERIRKFLGSEIVEPIHTDEDCVVERCLECAEFYMDERADLAYEIEREKGW